MAFGPGIGTVAGQPVRILEHPGLTATTDATGHWRIEGIPSGTTATFAIDAGTRYPIQTAAFAVGTEDLAQVTFQSPTHAMVGLFEKLLRITSDPDRCHIATTVTRAGYSLYLGAPDGTHGEPGATVSIDPVPPEGGTPIYFDGAHAELIWPNPKLTATSPDGGVLFANVTPGTYVLRAHKGGATIREVTVGCRAGVLTNASPPWGLQVLAGGLGPDDTVPFRTTTTTTSTTTASSTSTSHSTVPSTSTAPSTSSTTATRGVATAARPATGAAAAVTAQPRLTG